MKLKRDGETKSWELPKDIQNNEKLVLSGNKNCLQIQQKTAHILSEIDKLLKKIIFSTLSIHSSLFFCYL